MDGEAFLYSSRKTSEWPYGLFIYLFPFINTPSERNLQKDAIDVLTLVGVLEGPEKPEVLQFEPLSLL